MVFRSTILKQRNRASKHKFESNSQKPYFKTKFLCYVIFLKFFLLKSCFKYYFYFILFYFSFQGVGFIFLLYGNCVSINYFRSFSFAHNIFFYVRLSQNKIGRDLLVELDCKDNMQELNSQLKV